MWLGWCLVMLNIIYALSCTMLNSGILKAQGNQKEILIQQLLRMFISNSRMTSTIQPKSLKFSPRIPSFPLLFTIQHDKDWHNSGTLHKQNET